MPTAWRRRYPGKGAQWLRQKEATGATEGHLRRDTVIDRHYHLVALLDTNPLSQIKVHPPPCMTKTANLSLVMVRTSLLVLPLSSIYMWK